MRQTSATATIFALFIGLILTINTSAAQTDIPGPAGSGTFGDIVRVLPNGNIVVVDTRYDLSGPTVTDVGAVHLYNGATLALISTLTGSTANDNVGSGGITVLANGNYVVRSPLRDNPVPAVLNSGAVTWCSATLGCSGPVSASNSLLGGTADDSLDHSVTPLTNGNYVVSSPNWDNPSLGAANNAGAATWGNGTSGTVGFITSSNSLVGSTVEDSVGINGVLPLTNGNYVVITPFWDNPSTLTVNVGAITWGSGTSGISGLVSSANSLIGGLASDAIGSNSVRALTNGNYVVSSGSWTNPSPLTVDVGAVTWGNGAGGTVGFVTSSNSLIGGTAGDGVGGRAPAVLTNGNYVVPSPSWDNPSPLRADVGAATWCNGAGGTVGLVLASNSLIGGTAGDRVGGAGQFGVTALTNGTYVVSSSNWDNPSPLTVDVGAVTRCGSATGCSGTVSASNSLIGGTASDQVGSGGVTALTNGNYVVNSTLWDNPVPAVLDSGAVTWCSTLGCIGTVSASNSLLGGTADDFASTFVTPLTNGNYVVRSPNWDNPSLGAANNAGAVTWGNGTSGTFGFVTSSNALVGGTAGDQVGSVGVTALTNGNYVVRSSVWDNPSPLTVNVGAVTWGNGTSGISGLVSSANSLIGGTTNDQVGTGGIGALTSGNYVVISIFWDNPSPLIPDVGAVTYGLGSGGTTGLITAANSVRGTVPGGISSVSFDAVRVVVGRGASNIVSIFTPQSAPRAPFDLDGDGKTDLSIFRPNGASSEWWWLKSGGGNAAVVFGANTDTIVPADYTGDGKTDIAFWRPSNGNWFVLRSEDFSFFAAPFGSNGDVPVPGDFDADGKADLAVFRPSTLNWFINKSSGGTDIFTFGAAGDKPVPGDFDGDGKADIAVFRPNGGTGTEWWVRRSSNGVTFALQFGAPTDKAVPGDYTGDGKADIAFWRPSNGNWFVLRSEDSSFFAFPFGANGDTPVPGDYDGDGKWDAGVFRPSASTWFIQRSTAGTLIQQFGLTGDLPLPSAFVR